MRLLILCLFPTLLQGQDWLVSLFPIKADVQVTADKKELTLFNGLVSRTFRLTPNLACVGFKNLTSGEDHIRAVKPEARIILHGKTYQIGGLYGQKQNGYLLRPWLDDFTAHEADFQFQSYEISEIQPRFPWKKTQWSGNSNLATGKEVVFHYAHPAEKGIDVSIHYEIYDGIPLICKWLTIKNLNQEIPIKIDQVTHEILAVHEEESAVVGRPERMKKPHGLYFESNYCYNNAMRADLSDQSTHWGIDSAYKSQVNYDYNTPCLVEIRPAIGPGINLEKGTVYESIRTWELLLDSYDRERNGLARRHMYHAIAPWTAQNPIFMHLVSTEPEIVRRAIDQCAETGYEMVILSFGSGLNMEDTSRANIEKYKALADYAHNKGVGLGGYSLFSSRRISDADDVIDPITGQPDKGAFFGHAPCMGSQWGLSYLEKLKYFFAETGFDIFENDGPYPGDLCASKSHPGHTGLEDSQWRQMELQKGLYHWLIARGVYINAPDWYFLDGSHKIGMGYREVNFSLPRAEQVIMNRQHVYDGTWEKSPSMGWMFVPLTEYQGGGAAATLEPLHEHLDAYKTLMIQNYGAGAQACYRGPRLYDTEETKSAVTAIIQWYKKYRDILNSEIIHLRRPDGRDWDGILHVNPYLQEKGFLMVFNPTEEAITRTLKIPLYYTGLAYKAEFEDENGQRLTATLNRAYEATVGITIPANGMRWMVIR